MYRICSLTSLHKIWTESLYYTSKENKFVGQKLGIVIKLTLNSYYQRALNMHIIQCGTRCWWCSLLRHCATSRKFAGSIPDGVIGIFHWHNLSGRTKALGLTQPLTEMSTRNISWGVKGDRCVGLTTLPPSCADCLLICEPQPLGTLTACPAL